MQRYRINSPHIVSEVFADEEAAVINLKTGNYYSLNKTATQIWSLVEEGMSFSNVTDFILDKFIIEDSFKTAEIEQFIKKLIEEDLIVVDETLNLVNPDSANVTDSTTKFEDKKVYESPILECYADMQELLLLDPIHEVEETNWLVNKTQ